MMTLNEFIETAESDIRGLMAEDGVVFIRNCVEKLQGRSYTALTVMPAGRNAGANLNMEMFYEMYRQGESYDEVLQLAAEHARFYVANMPDFNSLDISSYDSVKRRLIPCMIGTSANAEMLAKLPHAEIEDMSVVYRIVMEGYDNGGGYSTLVTREMMSSFGITIEQLHADSIENASGYFPARVNSIEEFLPELHATAAYGCIGMYVATNMKGTFGASVILYPGLLENTAGRLGGSFFILPSSVHEMILIPDDGHVEAAALLSMVMSINETEVSPEDRLTDSLYRYDADECHFDRIIA